MHFVYFMCFIKLYIYGSLYFVNMVAPLGPVYTKRKRQRCDDAWDSVLTENSRVA